MSHIPRKEEIYLHSLVTIATQVTVLPCLIWSFWSTWDAGLGGNELALTLNAPLFANTNTAFLYCAGSPNICSHPSLGGYLSLPNFISVSCAGSLKRPATHPHEKWVLQSISCARSPGKSTTADWVARSTWYAALWLSDWIYLLMMFKAESCRRTLSQTHAVI